MMGIGMQYSIACEGDQKMTSPRTHNIRGIVFDWTWVLMDEVEPTGYAHLAAIEKLGGRKVTFDEWRKHIGSDWRPFYLEHGVSPSEFHRVLEVFGKEYEHIAGQVRPYPGVIEMLEKVKERGFATAVVSSQARDVLLLSARRHCLVQYFDLIVASEDISPSKPNPAALWYALRTLKLQPSETLYLDDMEDGIKMGLQAGVIVAGVYSALSQDLSRADFKINGAASLLDCLDGLVLRCELTRPVELATKESIEFIEERYEQKAQGVLPRVSALYHADNIAFANQILEWSIIPDQVLMVDVGCGMSCYSQHILHSTRGLSFQIDISYLALTHGKLEREASGDLSSLFPIASDAASLPLADSSFDIAVCSETLEHVVDDRAVLAELWRVLKPNGHLVISVPSSLHRTLPLFRHLQRQFSLAGHVREYDTDELASLLNARHFEVIDARGSSYFAYWLIFSIERSQMAVWISKWLVQYPRVGVLVQRALTCMISLENRLFGKFGKWGMCSLYLARKHQTDSNMKPSDSEHRAM